MLGLRRIERPKSMKGWWFDSKYVVVSKREAEELGGDVLTRWKVAPTIHGEEKEEGKLDKEKEALDWARNNPTDPRAKKILDKLGVK